METLRLQCPACRRPVVLARAQSAIHSGGHANIPDDPGWVCLDHDDACTRRECPVFHVPSVVMGVRRFRSGLDARPPHPSILLYCGGCLHETEQEVLDADHAVCRVCSTTNPQGPGGLTEGAAGEEAWE